MVLDSNFFEYLFHNNNLNFEYIYIIFSVILDIIQFYYIFILSVILYNNSIIQIDINIFFYIIIIVELVHYIHLKIEYKKIYTDYISIFHYNSGIDPTGINIISFINTIINCYLYYIMDDFNFEYFCIRIKNKIKNINKYYNYNW